MRRCPIVRIPRQINLAPRRVTRSPVIQRVGVPVSQIIPKRNFVGVCYSGNSSINVIHENLKNIEFKPRFIKIGDQYVNSNHIVRFWIKDQSIHFITTDDKLYHRLCSAEEANTMLENIVKCLQK
jgi:hypothetical protein